MIRKFAISVLATAVSVAVVGCTPNTYQPNATDTQLSAYAGQAAYPQQLTASQSPHVFASIKPDNTITLWNAGDVPLTGFDLWVNKTFVLHVDKLDARSAGIYSPNTLYNRTGMNLASGGNNPVATIQVRSNEQLMDVQGPIPER